MNTPQKQSIWQSYHFSPINRICYKTCNRVTDNYSAGHAAHVFSSGNWDCQIIDGVPFKYPLHWRYRTVCDMCRAFPETTISPVKSGRPGHWRDFDGGRLFSQRYQKPLQEREFGGRRLVDPVVFDHRVFTVVWYDEVIQVVPGVEDCRERPNKRFHPFQPFEPCARVDNVTIAIFQEKGIVCVA